MIRRELRGALQRIRGSRRPKHWDGVYAHRAEVPADGAGFQSKQWLDQARAATKTSMAAGGVGSAFVGSDVQLLATVLASVPTVARILDFGGGMGIGYVHLRQTLQTARPLDYVIVDDAANCREGRRLHAGDREVQFSEELPSSGERFDLVYAGSSVQYIDDLASLLGRWSAYQPRWLVLGDVPATDEAAFWTGQLTIAGSVIPYHVRNLGELLDLCIASGFRLAVRGVFRRLDAQIGARRLDRTYNLVFER